MSLKSLLQKTSLGVATGLTALALCSPINSQQVKFLYDDFSYGILDTSKWEVRQDTELQPLMDEYWIDSSLNNYHTQQNTIEDRRVYLFPKINFSTGDILEYEANLISKEGNYGQMVLLTGDEYIRIGIFGYNGGVQGFDELGTAKVKLEFQEGNLMVQRETPSGNVLIDNLPLSQQNGNYSLYVGSFSGHNGKCHIDFDNFYLTTDQFPVKTEETTWGRVKALYR